MKLHRTLGATFLALALWLSPNASAAFDLSAKPIGNITKWRSSSGTTSLEVLARDDKLFKLGYTRDSSKGQPAYAILWVRKDGQLVEITNSSGDWTRFKPHNCELTLGKCRYTERHSSGPKRKMIHLASMSDGKITYALYHSKVSPDNLVEKGAFSVDKYGYVIDHDYSRADGTPRWSRRIGKAEPAN